MRLFEQTFQISSRTRVLDVGGSALIWEFASVRPQLTVLNLPGGVERTSWPFDIVYGDGRCLPFDDGAFDVVFSNSVIEHVGSRADQEQFAREVARVGRQYWIQTPNRHFPLEMHLMLPFVHFLPRSWQAAVVNRFTVWERIARPSEAARAYYLNHFLHELKLLDSKELQSLFPNSTVVSERVLGLRKSLIAFRA